MIKNIKIYLPDSSSLEDDIYLEGAFKITVDKTGKPLSVVTEDKKLLIIGRDCELYREEEVI